MSWAKLNHLLPEPQCSTRTENGVFTISNWKDPRPQPTMAEIDAVTDADVDADIEKLEEDNFNWDGIMQTIAKAFHNHENRLRALEGKQPINLRQVVKALRKL